MNKAELNLRTFQEEYETLAARADALLTRARKADRGSDTFPCIDELRKVWERLQSIEDACRTQFAVNMSSLALVAQEDSVVPRMVVHEQKYSAVEITSLLVSLNARNVAAGSGGEVDQGGFYIVDDSMHDEEK